VEKLFKDYLLDKFILDYVVYLIYLFVPQLIFSSLGKLDKLYNKYIIIGFIIFIHGFCTIFYLLNIKLMSGLIFSVSFYNFVSALSFALLNCLINFIFIETALYLFYKTKNILYKYILSVLVLLSLIYINIRLKNIIDINYINIFLSITEILFILSVLFVFISFVYTIIKHKNIYEYKIYIKKNIIQIIVFLIWVLLLYINPNISENSKESFFINISIIICEFLFIILYIKRKIKITSDMKNKKLNQSKSI
jgi:hypothetical protein